MDRLESDSLILLGELAEPVPELQLDGLQPDVENARHSQPTDRRKTLPTPRNVETLLQMNTARQLHCATTQRSPVGETRTPGSARGLRGNGQSYLNAKRELTESYKMLHLAT